MSKDLQKIFESITPDNIQDVPLVQDAMKIFIETLEEMSSESIDVAKIYENENIKEELVKIYLDDLYTVFQNIQFNKRLIDKIDQTNSLYGVEYYKKDAILNLVNSINEEHLFTIRSFKEKKGTAAAIKYIYDLVSVFTLSEANEDFELTELGTFNFDVSGSLPQEFYEYIVRPLAHPLGFVFAYNQSVKLALEDYFPVEKFVYEINSLEVRKLLEDGSTEVYDFKYDNGQLRTVVDIVTTMADGVRTKKIIFEDGSYLKQVTDTSAQTYVFYMDANDNIVIEFEGQCSIYFDYNLTFISTVTDEISFTSDKNTYDYFARLDPGNDTYSGNLPSYEIGFNDRLDQDGNISLTSEGRWENFYKPSISADLKLLEGKYVYNYDVYEGGNYIGTQPIKYVDYVVPEHVSVSRVLTPDQYVAQNTGNEEYAAQEHSFEDLYIDTSWTPSDDLDDNDLGYLSIEPIYNLGEYEIGGNHKVGNEFVPLLIGDSDYYIGLSGQILNFNQRNPIDLNPNLAGIHSMVSTLHEPVNFQYYTYDSTQFDYIDTFSEIFNEVITNISFEYTYDTFSETFDTTTETISPEVYSEQELNSYIEPNYTSSVALLSIGQSGVTLGDGHYIQYYEEEITVQGDPYFIFDKTNAFIDENNDNFSFGVYRNDVLLEDNNISALA